jgi:hypothetical protein
MKIPTLFKRTKLKRRDLGLPWPVEMSDDE